MWIISTLSLLACVSSILAMPQGETMDTTTESPYDIVEDNAEAEDDTSSKGSVERCATVMENNGYNISSFWHGAAHGIHSINLEEIKYFFEPKARIQNKIPVVNSDLSSENTILFDAPMAGYAEDFKTMSLKVMAYFMRNDRPDFAIQGANALEKLTHQFHMHEIYVIASEIYQLMKKSPPQDQELCPCVNDVTGNGIMNELVNIAKKMRYFNRNGRAKDQFDYYVLGGCFEYHTTSSCGSGSGGGAQIAAKPAKSIRPISRPVSQKPQKIRGRRSTNNQTALIEEYEREYLKESTKENAKNLLNLRPWKPNTLVGPEQWISYEAMLTKSMLDEKEMKDFATFMYCKLNEPLDHPKDLFEL